MICVAANQRDSLDHVEKWRNEIEQTVPGKPIMLILTKSDLLQDQIDDDPVTLAQLREESEKGSFQGAMATSAKEWEKDYNVHKAFNKVLATAYDFKYELN